MENLEEIQKKYSDDLIQSELYNNIRRGMELTPVEFLLCSRNLKEMYLQDKKKKIGFLEFKSCDDDLKKLFIDNSISNDKTISIENFNTLSQELKDYYIDLVIPSIKLSLDVSHFKQASDSKKLEYLIYRGLNYVCYDMREWYCKWRKIKLRDLNIDKILLDEE